jgi:hypothetical protein
MNQRKLFLLVWLAPPWVSGAALDMLPEYLRPDPYGGLVAADRQADRRDVVLRGARGGWVSFQLVVKPSPGGPYRLEVKLAAPAGHVQAELFREWFHRAARDGSYYPDALIPVAAPVEARLPDPDNRIEGQTAQAYWVDLWIAKDAPPGRVSGEAALEWPGGRERLPFELEVLPAAAPEEDIPTIDHNSYGSSWIAAYYKPPEQSEAEFFASDRFFELIHAHHRIFYEHRGVFHQLGYGHGGKVGPEFAPTLTGSGRNRRVSDWTLYDRHYGPLLDGSAFAGTRRGNRPIPFVYLPINPEWPASFLWWGEPGYEVEFVNVVSEMERHFREKGWTRTNFELFFNHKKRYKAFPWDGDETRFPEDDRYFVEYRRLLGKAVPADSPVRFRFRADSSWAMERQFRNLAGVVDFWVCGRSLLSWYPEAAKLLKQRGDIVWFYSGPPAAFEVSTAITKFPLTAWMWGVDGYIHWLTVNAGADPWFRFDGGSTALVYPGTRFGISGPIPSIRLKIQRNCVQDIALLESLGKGKGIEALRREVARRYNGSQPHEWWTPRPKLADTPPYEWSNTDIDEATDLDERLFARLDPGAWQRVRDYVHQLVREAR